ncbi:hypothetical protein ACU61A_15615 [Pseudonocardia sichuanensis]
MTITELIDPKVARQVARRRAMGELRREQRLAKDADERAARAAREDEDRRRRAAAAEERERVRAERAARRTTRRAQLAEVARRLRPVAPLALVTGFAMYGQVAYGLAHYTAPTVPLPMRLLVAVGAAVAVESIALYVAWHAHDALLQRATATAARLRCASYVIALAVASVNYTHFAGDRLAPTPGAIVFALFSAAGPWLWGLHTRRAQHLQLVREGHADSAGAVFSAERFFAFPWRTWMARRWSIDHGVSDPRTAWEGYRLHAAARAAERAAKRARRREEKAAERARRDEEKARRGKSDPADPPSTGTHDETIAEESSAPGAGPSLHAIDGTAADVEGTSDPADPGGELPDRRAGVNTANLHAVIADLQALNRRTGRRYARDDIRQMYGIKSDRAMTARRMLGWADGSAGVGAAGSGASA